MRLIAVLVTGGFGKFRSVLNIGEMQGTDF